ncbi:36e2a951-d464-403c-a585-ae5b8d13a663 [Thermothielavioides terrestris]|uniref:36e2a951-d464-403c-a585-ae5b8d13a663 n=1 Tax=Thermothielavioides terrestris TaxID=2587410 RepID=A0A446BL92_9PEZI|nr:36e2a951-d464-403c-a585-ae5b8d13a663 [Thermothielavioides terrestris]
MRTRSAKGGCAEVKVCRTSTYVTVSTSDRRLNSSAPSFPPRNASFFFSVSSVANSARDSKKRLGHLHEVVGVEPVEVDELENLLRVVVRVDAERLADVVGEPGIAEVELDVEDVAVIVERRESAVLLDVDGEGLDRKVGTQVDLRAVRLLEDEALGGFLPAVELQRRLRLVLLEGHKAGRLQPLGKGPRQALGGSLAPRSSDLNLLERLLKGVGQLGQNHLILSDFAELGELLQRDLGPCDPQEGELGEQLGILLQGGRVRRVENEELEALLPNLFSRRSRDPLLEVILLEAGQPEDELAARLGSLDNVNILEQLLFADEDDISLLDSKGGLNWLLGTPNIGANCAALNEVIEHLMDVDVARGLASEQLANGRRRGDGGRVVDIPESVLACLLQGREGHADAFLPILAGEAENDRNDRAGSVDGGCGILDIHNGRLLQPAVGKGHGGEHIRDGNLPHRLGKSLEEGLFDERPVDTDVDGADLLAVGGQGIHDLLGKLGFGAAEDHEDQLGRLVAMVLEGRVGRAKLGVEKAKKLDHLSGSVQSLVQRAGLLGDLLVDLGNGGLAQRVDDPQCLPRDAQPVVDVERGQQGSKQGGQKRHVLGLVGRNTRHEAQAEVLGNLQGALVLGDEAVMGRVVGSGDVGNKGAGNAVEERELVEGGPQVAEAQRGRQQGLGDVTLAEVEILGEDVAERKGAGAGPGLQRHDHGGLAVGVLLAGARPLLDGLVEVEGLGREGEDLVRELVGRLLNEQLAGDIGRPADGAEREVLLAGRDGLEALVVQLGLGARGDTARGDLVLQLHVVGQLATDLGSVDRAGGEGGFKSRDSAARKVSRQK